MSELSTKPYLIRAIYEWCCDNGFTPHLAVAVDARTRVPQEFVRDGEIVLSIGFNATRNLVLGNELIQFSARFNGAARDVAIPVAAVIGIYARENGQGFFFPKEESRSVEDSGALPPQPEQPAQQPPSTTPRGKPDLKRVK